MVPATLDPNSPLDDTIGAYYLGTVVSAMLYGICFLQGVLYFQKHRQDPWYFKAAVIIVAISGTIQVVLAVMGVYFYVITNYHHPSNLQYLFRPNTIEAIFIGASSSIMQVFYTYRIWRLSDRNWLLSSVILLLICCEFGAGTAWASSAATMKTYSDLLKLKPLVISTNVLFCCVDVVITTSLCILLHRARTGLKRADSIINKLILFVISTGLLTTIFAIAVFICVLASPYSLIYGGFFLCLGPLYTNSFLSTLNYRSTINEEFELNLIPSGMPPETGRMRTLRSIQFQMETLQEVTRDEETSWGENTIKANGHGKPSDPDP